MRYFQRVSNLLPVFPGADAKPWQHFEAVDWSVLSLVLLLACLVRVTFFTGLFGSDDVVYLMQALSILHGDWNASNYIGAIRYGVNLPMAGFMAVFGLSEFNANLWALLCSLGEVTVVFVLARQMWGVRAAVLSSLVLGLLPLHVNLSGRLLADTPLAFFVTFFFALFYFAERYHRPALYLIAGLSLGTVYWVKQSVAALIVPLLLLYAIAARGFRREWIWVIFGAASMVMLNMALFWGIAGDPFYVFRTMAGGLWVGAHTSPGYYFYYLFVNVRHTWLMPFLAAAGLWVWWRGDRSQFVDTAYVVFWGLGLLLILSFCVVSVSPFAFIFKQTNYMLIFSAPFALLAGYALMRLRGTTLALVLLLGAGGSILLSALEQQAIRVFTSNSRAALTFAAMHPGIPVYGTDNAANLADAVSALEGRWPSRPLIHALTELASERSPFVEAPVVTQESDTAAYVVLDMETLDWSHNQLRITPGSVPSCWTNKGVLEPRGFGVGKTVLSFLRYLAETGLPRAVAEQVLSVTESLFQPRPAYIYAIPTGCSFRLVHGTR